MHEAIRRVAWRDESGGRRGLGKFGTSLFIMMLAHRLNRNAANWQIRAVADINECAGVARYDAD
jgi:hypothetical protein